MRWEYRTYWVTGKFPDFGPAGAERPELVHIARADGSSDRWVGLEAFMEELGADSWELVAVVGTVAEGYRSELGLFFKRAL